MRPAFQRKQPNASSAHQAISTAMTANGFTGGILKDMDWHGNIPATTTLPAAKKPAHH